MSDGGAEVATEVGGGNMEIDKADFHITATMTTTATRFLLNNFNANTVVVPQ